MLAVTCAALLTAGLLVGLAAARRPPSLVVRRRVGIALVAVVCVLPFAALTSVAMSDRGLGGTISDRVDDLTAEGAPRPRGVRGSARSPVRAGDTGARRARCSRTIRGPAPGRARSPCRASPTAENGSSARHAHGFLAQTIADLGLLGLAAGLALLAAWLAAAARATGFFPRRRPGPGWPPERIALCALALCAVVFGLHSLLDWIWFVPGPTVAALAAAGFVAGRGPLPGLDERAATQADASKPDPASERRARLGDLLPAGNPGPARLLAAAGVLVTALLCAAAVWQPERAHRATDRALAALDRGDLADAADEADRARDIDPYSPEPLWAKAEVFAKQRQLKRAYRTYEQAVLEHPRDPEPWLRLGRFELDEVGDPGQGVRNRHRRDQDRSQVAAGSRASQGRAQAALNQ